ncbi:MAG: CPBP family intramembrane glutamic endopeptidase [Gemmatimonadota bacterium]|nr:CPBP family intramembrane glutamic endopeptidase [Gemmatimonadota bacterium]
MDRLNIVSFIFLVVLFVIAPRAALRAARLLRQMQAGGQPLPRRRMVLSTMFSLSVLWALSALNAESMGRGLFAVWHLGAREVLIGAGGFVVLLAAIPISRWGRTPEEERRRLVYGMAPRDGQEMALFTLVAVMAGVAEEAAYRGVAVWILAPIFGSVVPAILLSAMAFAVAHAVQGGRAMAIVFAIALVFHGIVQLTGTLVIAMVVHAAYDVVAGFAAGRRAKELLAMETPGPAAPTTG